MSSDKHEQPDDVVIPLVEERLQVGKREIETGRIRVQIRNELKEVRVAEELVRGNVDIERVRIDRQIDIIPDIEDRGDVIIIPVVEEVLVFEKRLMLREEIHLRRRASTERHEETVTLTSQRAVVERIEPVPPASTPEPKEV